ncbi:hypothetical protein TNCV_1871781 [Trichonephila clavipes]|nr:hypothetical protein TNCV_1871781 [Trichonephila clavipes]
MMLEELLWFTWSIQMCVYPVSLLRLNLIDPLSISVVFASLASQKNDVFNEQTLKVHTMQVVVQSHCAQCRFKIISGTGCKRSTGPLGTGRSKKKLLYLVKSSFSGPFRALGRPPQAPNG